MDFILLSVCKVQEPPSWVLKPYDVQGIETEKAEFKCQALGSPHPTYTWVDREGIDATDKEGMGIINSYILFYQILLIQDGNWKQTLEH